jgi:hypothetical protein
MSGIHIITESYSEEERKTHAKTIKRDLENIGFVDSVYCTPVRMGGNWDKVEFGVYIKSEKKVINRFPKKKAFKITQHLNSINATIKNTLDDHTDVFNDTWMNIESPEWVDTNMYKTNMYKITVPMI